MSKSIQEIIAPTGAKPIELGRFREPPADDGPTFRVEPHTLVEPGRFLLAFVGCKTILARQRASNRPWFSPCGRTRNGSNTTRILFENAEDSLEAVFKAL